MNGFVTARRLRSWNAEHATNPELVSRFLNEARAANSIHHPSVVAISEFGKLDDGSPYMVMEYLEGQSLSAMMRAEGGRLQRADVLRIIRQIASALCAVHKQGIVHRDLKPANFMIVADPEAPGGCRAKLLDFGIAKMATEDVESSGGQFRTRTGVLMGTPAYMSPEQCRGAGGVDEKSDVYSLGVILFQTLAGHPPFVSRAPGEIIAMHMYMPPPSLRDLDGSIPPPLIGLVDAMLAKKPQERPTMVQVAAKLEQLGAPPTMQMTVPGHTARAAEQSQGLLLPGVVISALSQSGLSMLRRRPARLVLLLLAALAAGGWLFFRGDSRSVTASSVDMAPSRHQPGDMRTDMAPALAPDAGEPDRLDPSIVAPPHSADPAPRAPAKEKTPSNRSRNINRVHHERVVGAKPSQDSVQPEAPLEPNQDKPPNAPGSPKYPLWR